MNQHPPRLDQPTLFILVLSLFVGFITALQEVPLTTRSLPMAEMASLSPAHIAPSTPSKETTTAEKVIAEKVDLERKLIQPQTAAEEKTITDIIQESGGEVITKDGVLVVRVPQEKEAEIQEKLKEEEVAGTFEIDYPTFLTSDNPDWGVVRIAAPDVWDVNAAQGVRVAVIDTGIDYTHPDLSGRYSGGYDTVNADADPFDDHGHGTHVSGIIAADLNQSGLAGVAPQASMFAVKALAADGSGYISDLIEAIDWAMNNGAQIINFSIGTTYDSSLLESKLQEAAKQGIILVAAAGNTHGGSVLYPAAYNSVISVAATDGNDNFASFSSVGAELAAPGVSINSTVPGGGYAAWSGTSMAAPHVTATAALMLGNGQANIRQGLRNTAIDLGTAGTDSLFGYGLVHAKPAALGEDTLSPLVTFLVPENGAVVSDMVEVLIDIQDENTLQGANLSINGYQIASWLEAPYSFGWDTTDLEAGEYELWVQATDIFNNLGQAKITVTLNPNASPTPTPSPTSTPPGQLKRAEKNTDSPVNQPGEAAEHRKNYRQTDIEPKTTPVPESMMVPETTNIHNRQQVPAETNSVQSAEEEKQDKNQPSTFEDVSRGNKPSEHPGKGNVKGAATRRLREFIFRFFFPTFN